MSFRHLSFILDRVRAEGTHLLVLIALAEYANAEGECFPSIRSLARRARRSERRIQQVVAEMVEWGWIEIIRKGGRGFANDYRLVCQAMPRIGPGEIEDDPDGIERVQPASPFCGPERVKSGGERVKPQSERVKSGAGKGETQISPQPLNQENQGEARACARTTPPHDTKTEDLDDDPEDVLSPRAATPLPIVESGDGFTAKERAVLDRVRKLGGKLKTRSGEDLSQEWLDTLTGKGYGTSLVERGFREAAPCEFPSRFREWAETHAQDHLESQRQAREFASYSRELEQRQRDAAVRQARESGANMADAKRRIARLEADPSLEERGTATFKTAAALIRTEASNGAVRDATLFAIGRSWPKDEMVTTTPA